MINEILSEFSGIVIWFDELESFVEACELSVVGCVLDGFEDFSNDVFFHIAWSFNKKTPRELNATKQASRGVIIYGKDDVFSTFVFIHSL